MMKSKATLALLTVLAVMSVGSVATAQEAAAGANGGVRTQEFNFTDELVTGSLVRPDGATSRVVRRGPGVSLIRIREHFVPEMLKSVENL